MRKLSKFAALLLVVALLATCAFAADVASPSQTGSDVELVTGTAPAGTELVKSDAPTDPEAAKALEAAEKEVKDTAAFVEDNAAVKSAVEEAGVDVKDVKVAADGIFDLSFVDAEGNAVEPTGPVTVTVTGVKDNIIVVAHNKETGEWEVLDFTQNGDEVTFTVNSLSPILFLTDGEPAPAKTGNKDGDKKDDGKKPADAGKVTSPQTGETANVYAIVAVVALLSAAAFCTTRAKRYAR